MICEMCGKNAPFLKKAIVEGSYLQVCKECIRFGEAGGKVDAVTGVPIISHRLDKREKRQQTKDVYDQMSGVLADDFSIMIKDKRRKMV